MRLDTRKTIETLTKYFVKIMRGGEGDTLLYLKINAIQILICWKLCIDFNVNLFSTEERSYIWNCQGLN